jgi:8-oxo-dGTP pyrophosphatase MutT (NUDIX family)
MVVAATDLIRRILSENPKKPIVDPSLTPAGVMLLLYPKDGEQCILLSKRTSQVEHHKGEICFPGGRKDPGDVTLLDTALRETYEEMGIHPENIELLGEVDDVPTTSRFLISPFVGAIPYPYEFAPSEREVAEILEVPISELMNPDNFRDETRIINGQVVVFPSYAYKGHLIYGATARVLKRFLELLEAALEKKSK